VAKKPFKAILSILGNAVPISHLCKLRLHTGSVPDKRLVKSSARIALWQSDIAGDLILPQKRGESMAETLTTIALALAVGREAHLAYSSSYRADKQNESP